MYEVEVKARLKDRQAFKTKLEGLGCKFSEELHQIDDIFTPTNEEFPPPMGRPVLRIRTQNGKFIFTLKINQSSRTDCIEREVVFDKKEQMQDIIKLMGFKHDVTVEKKRIKTMYKDVEIVLDTVDQLGEFVEAEKIVTESNPEVRKQIQEELMNLLVELGVERSDQVIDGKYDIMLEEKLKGK
jgi:adenylate cyclase class 2